MSSDFLVYDGYMDCLLRKISNQTVSNNWNLINNDNDITWEIVSVVGTTRGDKALNRFL